MTSHDERCYATGNAAAEVATLHAGPVAEPLLIDCVGEDEDVTVPGEEVCTCPTPGTPTRESSTSTSATTAEVMTRGAE